MVFYIALIIFHNQHESNYISMVFYIAIIIYDLIIISLILTLMFYVIYTCKLLLLFYYFFEKFIIGQKLDSNNLDAVYYVLRYWKSSPSQSLFFLQIVIFISELIVILTGQVVSWLDDLLHVITLFLVKLLYLRNPRSNPHCHVPLQNQNIVVWLLPGADMVTYFACWSIFASFSTNVFALW